MSSRGLHLSVLTIFCPLLCAQAGEEGARIAVSKGFEPRPFETILVLPAEAGHKPARLSLTAFVDACFSDSAPSPGGGLEIGFSAGPQGFGLTVFFSQAAAWVHETGIEDRYRTEMVGSEEIVFKDTVLVEEWKYEAFSSAGAGFYTRSRLAAPASVYAACFAGGVFGERGPGFLLRADFAVEWRFSGFEAGFGLLVEYTTLASRRLRLGAGAGFSVGF